MSAFPFILGSSSVSLTYPVSIRYICKTGFSVSANGTCQAFARSRAMAEFNMTLTEIPAADMTAINNHFASAKGKFDSTWTLDHDGFTYTGMRYEQDQISWEERGDFWSTKLKALGFCPTFSGIPGTFPSLDSGAVTQRPWGHGDRFETLSVDMPAGQRYTTALRGGGLTGFSATPIRGWDLVFQTASEAEAQKFLKWFVGQNGKRGTFSFTDPISSTVFTNCRHASDELTVTYNELNSAAFTLSVEQY